VTNSLKMGSLVAGLAIGLLSWTSAGAQTSPEGFTVVLPSDVKWAANPALLAGGQTAILLGDPGKAAPYVARTKFPRNFKMMPHTHPEVRTYTVLSGSLGVGFGDKFDAAKVKFYPAGSAFTLPANVAHFNLAGAKGAVFQINSVGPSSSDYVNPADDPRKK
jgi:quercetin dioxygenase-like cupin family protein